MDGADLAGEDRTFKINFGNEGMSRLRERVKEKLKEVMGDYTDDTLVVLRSLTSKDKKHKPLPTSYVLTSEESFGTYMIIQLWWGFSVTDSWTLLIDPAKNTEHLQVKSTSVVPVEDPQA